MVDPRVPLKNPLVSGLLAWLVPGAGHLYQGRYFKGLVYFVCILGLFLTGWSQADWSAVQPPDTSSREAFLRDKTLLLKFTAQLGVGLPSLTSLVQSRRASSESNERVRTIDAEVSAEFDGVLLVNGSPQALSSDVGSLVRRLESLHEEVDNKPWPLDNGLPVTGTITLAPAESDRGTPPIAATFAGTIDGQPADILLESAVIEEPIRAQSRRRVYAQARDKSDRKVRGILVASLPRPWLDRAGVPLSPRELNQLHGRHGNQLEIWLVFTWIAGLLNLLAIYDAVSGPALAYGDEEPAADAGEAPVPTGEPPVAKPTTPAAESV